MYSYHSHNLYSAIREIKFSSLATENFFMLWNIVNFSYSQCSTECHTAIKTLSAASLKYSRIKRFKQLKSQAMITHVKTLLVL